jgi:hypothetical protein
VREPEGYSELVTENQLRPALERPAVATARTFSAESAWHAVRQTPDAKRRLFFHPCSVSLSALGNMYRDRRVI